MTNYERRRRQIAEREYSRRRPIQNFNTWYNDSFLTDVLLMNIVLQELGPEEDYRPETEQPQEESNNEQETESNQYDNSSDSSSDYDSGSDSGGSDFSD